MIQFATNGRKEGEKGKKGLWGDRVEGVETGIFEDGGAKIRVDLVYIATDYIL